MRLVQCEPVERRAEVRCGRRRAGQPVSGFRPGQVRSGGLGKREIVAGVPVGQRSASSSARRAARTRGSSPASGTGCRRAASAGSRRRASSAPRGRPRRRLRRPRVEGPGEDREPEEDVPRLGRAAGRSSRRSSPRASAGARACRSGRGSSSESRESSRASSAAGSSSFSRAAASSSASGSPSSRRQISLDLGRGLGVRAHCLRAVEEQLDRRGLGQRVERILGLHRDVQRDAARHEQRRPGRAQELATAGAASCTCSKLSRTSSARWCSACRPRTARAPAARPAAPRRGRSAAASETKWAPSGNSSESSAASCRASRVLPVPPAPVIVTSRSVAEERGDLALLGRPADERVAASGKARPVQAAQRRERPGRAGRSAPVASGP